MAGTVTEGNDTDGSDEAGVVMAGTVTEGNEHRRERRGGRRNGRDGDRGQ